MNSFHPLNHKIFFTNLHKIFIDKIFFHYTLNDPIWNIAKILYKKEWNVFYQIILLPLLLFRVLLYFKYHFKRTLCWNIFRDDYWLYSTYLTYCNIGWRRVQVCNIIYNQNRKINKQLFIFTGSLLCCSDRFMLN